MAIVVDSQNVVSSLSEAPDKLRAEMGTYYNPSTLEPFQNFNTSLNLRGGINYFLENIITLEMNNQTLIPKTRARIFLSGREGDFRDQEQWEAYIKNTIRTGVSYLDHQFDLQNFSLEPGSIIKNFHDPIYEDLTKKFPSNQLINYNLVSYPFKDKDSEVSRIGDIRTRFDNDLYNVGVTSFFKDLISEYENRILNYTGSVEELSVKQRHIFDLQRPRPGFVGMTAAQLVGNPVIEESEFPFLFKKTLNQIFSSGEFEMILDGFGKRKQLLQSIKRDLSFSNRAFRLEGEDINGKIYNLIDLMNSSRIINFSSESDEIFLLPEDEISNSNISDRFVNSVNSVRFLGSMRNFIMKNSREYTDIVDSNPCKSFFLGYKIEKYLDNDATQPIQTYYSNDPNFIDSQLKYGRTYIYKTKILIGILGSKYEYQSLHFSTDESAMKGPQGTVSRFPVGYGKISSEKYRAYVDVQVDPSFQVLELQIDEDQTRFVDDPPNIPQVYFFNQPHKPSVEFFFSPLYEDRDNVDDKVRMEYFNGIYEIYRLNKAPSSMDEFEDGFLTSIDEQTTLTSLNPSWNEIPDYSKENMNGHYDDKIIQNQKYYYAFKAVSYHGVKSDFTTPFEVEMLRDSDEYKVVVKEYLIPSDDSYQYKIAAKRIMKITPNIERLLFSEEENTKDWKLDEGNMLIKGQTTKFKIRVTSKHTGKKMDINLNLKLDDRT